MSDERGRELLRISTALKSDRATFEQAWQEIADVMRPSAQTFTGSTPTPGEKRTSKIFDAVPPLALEKFAAVLEALLSPRNAIWSKLTTTDEELQEDIEVKRYLETVNRVLFRLRYRPVSNLASQLAESYLNLGSFGTQVLYIGDDIGRSIVYRSCGLQKVRIAEDQHGRVNQVFRDYSYTADQAVRAFVLGKAKPVQDKAWARLPQAIKSAYEAKSQTRFDFVHVVVPRDVVESDRIDYRGMAYAGLHLFANDGEIVDEGGFRTLPYAVSRYTKNTDELYGRSPAWLVLPDTNMLNRMNKSIVRVGEKAADPPLMAMDDSLAPFNLTPGAMNYGTLDEQGRPRVSAFQGVGETFINEKMLEQKRQVIREAFLLDVFQALVENPQMTATQVMEMTKDRATMLAPVMGRQQSELFGPMTERELDIANAAGLLPPMPDALIEAQGEVSIEYLSPMALAMRAEAGVSILRTIESVMPLAEAPGGQDALLVFNIEKSVRELAEINNYPATAMRSPAEIERMKSEQQARQQASDLLAAAPVVTQSLKSMAEAQNVMQPGAMDG